MARVLNLVQFAVETGGKTDHDVESHIHAGLRSKPGTKTYARWYDRTLRELQDARDATRTAYRAALASGELVAPERPSLEVTARGEGAAAEAARRVLAKRAARK
jgi:hypothetical protein